MSFLGFKGLHLQAKHLQIHKFSGKAEISEFQHALGLQSSTTLRPTVVSDEKVVSTCQQWHLGSEMCGDFCSPKSCMQVPFNREGQDPLPIEILSLTKKQTWREREAARKPQDSGRFWDSCLTSPLKEPQKTGMSHSQLHCCIRTNLIWFINTH